VAHPALYEMRWHDALPDPVAPSLPAVNADATPSRRIITDRDGVVLGPTTPGLAYLRLSKSADDRPLQIFQLSLESKSNKILDEELAAGIEKYSAKAAAGFRMDVNTGEIIALSSIESGDSQAQGAGTGNTPLHDPAR
jgi:hypothetical protein